MSNQKKCIALTVAVFLVFAASIAGLFIAHPFHFKKKIDPNAFHGTLLKEPRGINPFSLTGIDNKSFSHESLKGQWTMILFGFTHCGYVCPTTMAELNKMYRLLEDKQIRPLPRVVMISVDPERDDLQKLNHYVKAFNPNFFAARGEGEVVKQMTREMGVAYAKVEMPDAHDSENYDMQHSAALMLFNPQGKLIAFFTTPHQADLLAEDYQLLVS